MDPVSALGAAAAAISFVQFASKTVSLCKDVRDNAQNATSVNSELELQALNLRQVREDLATTRSVSTPISNLLSKVMDDCDQIAAELFDLLAKIKGELGSSAVNKAKAVFRALKEQKTVEKLDDQLRRRQQSLQLVLLAIVPDQFEKFSDEQRQAYGQLKSSHQEAIASWYQGYTELSKKTDDIQQGMSKLDLNVTDVRSDVGVMHGKLDDMAESTSQAARDHFESDFLSSLSFSDMLSRQDDIKDACHGTFEWALNGSIDRSQPWHPLSEWLRSGTSTYWICGKVGSGKSTLMRHLVNSDRCKSLLASRGERFTICSFFFFRPGSPLQRNITGLLRSLLYQVCKADSTVIHKLELASDESSGHVHAWSQRRLYQILCLALLHLADMKFYFFIDGLDEYSGESVTDTDELIDQINDLEAIPNVQMLVSSRLETSLQDRLAHCHTLRLEDLNYIDIFTFVNFRLRLLPNAGNLKFEVVKRASGVFLSAVLVCISLLEGSRAQDEEDVLLARLEVLPAKLSEMYNHMMGKIDGLHFAPLALTIRYLQEFRHLETRPSLLLLAAAVNAQNNLPFRVFLDKCERLQSQIVAQSKGYECCRMRRVVGFMTDALDQIA